MVRLIVLLDSFQALDRLEAWVSLICHGTPERTTWLLSSRHWLSQNIQVKLQAQAPDSAWRQ